MICIWRSNNCWFLQLESSENWSVSHTNHGFSLQFWLDFGLDLDGLVACSNQRWLEIQNQSKSQTHQNSINSIPWVFKDWGKSIWLWFAPSQVKDVCHPVSSPNSMYNRFLQTRGRAAKGWRLCRAFRGDNWWGWKNRIGWLVVSTHYKRSNQNQSLEVIKIITVDHHLQIWSIKNMSGTGMLPHKGRILRQFKRGIALYFETPPQNTDPISIIGCILLLFWLHQMFTKTEECLRHLKESELHRSLRHFGRQKQTTIIPSQISNIPIIPKRSKSPPWWVLGGRFSYVRRVPVAFLQPRQCKLPLFQSGSCVSPQFL